MPEIEGETEVEVTCPRCRCKFVTTVYVTLEFDWGDYAPDYP